MVRPLSAYCLLAVIACGPSLKQAHERSEHYQQCYAADYDPSLSPDQRRECWSHWLEAHSKDQPPERIAFAELRLRELAVDGAARPLPQDPAKPDPQLEHEYPHSPPGEYHSSSCTPVCHGRWDGCVSYCEIRDLECRAACESEYRICIEGCP